MITGEIKNRIDQIWDTFWTGGITNSMTILEQMTDLFFMKMLDDAQDKKEANAQALGIEPDDLVFKKNGFWHNPETDKDVPYNILRWKNFRHEEPSRMFSIVRNDVFVFIKNLGEGKQSAYSHFMQSAVFMIQNPRTLVRVVEGIQNLDMTDRDTMGDVYEYILGKMAASGNNGQFRTPRHIIRMMVELMQPRPDDVICDPACGTSGFLVAAGEYLKDKYREDIFFSKQKKDHYMNHMFFGYDMDRTMLRIGAMNMMTHGVDNPFIEYRDSLSDQNPDKEKYSLILANPPFKGSLDADTVSADLLKVCKTKKTELLFLALFLRMLKVGGRGAVIVPDGVLFGSSSAHKAIRQELVDGNRLEAVISMPSGVFKPYAGVSTGILVFTKTGHGGTDKVWFYDMTADGFSLDDKRTPVTENDIPDIIARFHSLRNVGAGAPDGPYNEANNPRTAKSFLVPKAEIVENGYDLSINKYKKTEYKAVEYASTSQILAELHELEAEITKGLKELEGML